MLRSSDEGRLARRGSRPRRNLIDDLDALLDARSHGMRAGSTAPRRPRCRHRPPGRPDRQAARAAVVDSISASRSRCCAPQQSWGFRSPRPTICPRTTSIASCRSRSSPRSPIRVGKRRAPRSSEIVFAGRWQRHARRELVGDRCRAAGRGRRRRDRRARPGDPGADRRAERIDPAWLLDLYLDRIVERDELVWNASSSASSVSRR